MYLRYFGIRVSDLERSLKFYAELFGLQEVSRGSMAEYGGGRGAWVLLRDPISGQQIELNMYPKGSKYDTPYIPGEGLDHLGFMVRDVASKYKELMTKGAESTEITPEETECWQGIRKGPRRQLDRAQQIIRYWLRGAT